MIDYTLSIINNINSLIELNFIYALFLYFILTTIFFTLSLPGGLVVMISSGFLFGFYYGFIINIVSIVIGSYIFFIFIKYFFTNYFNKYLVNYNNKINGIIKSFCINLNLCVCTREQSSLPIQGETTALK